MKFFVDSDEVFDLNETKKKVLKNDIRDEIFSDDLKRRVRWIIEHKYEECFARLKKEWEPKLAARGVEMLPVDQDSFAELIFSQADYKNRSKRELEASQGQ